MNSGGGREALNRLYASMAEGNFWVERDLYDPYIVYLADVEDTDPGPHYGLEALVGYMRGFLESWDDWRVEALGFESVGDTVVVQVRRTAVGKHSGVPIEDTAYWSWTLRGDAAIRLEVFRERADAVAAAAVDDSRGALERLYAQWAVGDHSDASLYDPHFVGVFPDPSPSPQFGRAAVRDYMRRLLESWDDLRFTALRYREAGDTYVVDVHRSGAGRTSGVPVDDSAFHVWTFRGEKAIRLDVHTREQTALDVAGLCEAAK